MIDSSEIRDGHDMLVWLLSAKKSGKYVTAEVIQLDDDPEWGNSLVLCVCFGSNAETLVECPPDFTFTRTDMFIKFWELIGVCQQYADEFDDELVRV